MPAIAPSGHRAVRRAAAAPTRLAASRATLCATRATSSPTTRSPASPSACSCSSSSARSLGPSLVPYDPLASDTRGRAPGRPRCAHWFGTDQLGRDILQPRRRRGPARPAIAIFSVALVFAVGGLAGHRGRLLRRLDGPDRRPASPTPSWPSRSSCSRWASWRRSATRSTNIVLATAIINFPLYARLARAEANVRRNAGFVQAARLTGNTRLPHRARPPSCRTSCRS